MGGNGGIGKNPYTAGPGKRATIVWGGQWVVFCLMAVFLLVCLLLHEVLSTTREEEQARRIFFDDAVSDRTDRLGMSRKERKRRKWERLRQEQDVAMGVADEQMEAGMLADGNKGMSEWEYEALRKEFEAEYPPNDEKRLLEFVAGVRRPFSKDATDRFYNPIKPEDMSYDPWNCPTDKIPQDYPVSWNVMTVLENWNPDDTTPHEKIHHSLCVFRSRQDAKLYREKELPFVLRDDLEVLHTVERWNRGGKPSPYLKKLLDARPFRADYSESNHFMFFRVTPRSVPPPGWKEPTETVPMHFSEWLDKVHEIEQKEEALAQKKQSNVGAKVASPRRMANEQDIEHWYFRINAKNPQGRGFMYEELPFFKPNLGSTFFMVDPSQERGINCRFGPRGTVAENHYDSSRNFVIVLGGDRRYVLSAPQECPRLALHPPPHPSGRHSAVDWAQPDVKNYPQFPTASVNEVILQAGDALYLPTQWFHYIISIDTSYQCNARSGHTSLTDHVMRECGFLG